MLLKHVAIAVAIAVALHWETKQKKMQDSNITSVTLALSEEDVYDFTDFLN